MLWTKEWGLKELALRILIHAPNICPEKANIGKIPPRGYKIFRTTFESIISWRWSAGACHPRFSVKLCRWKEPWPILRYCFNMWFKARTIHYRTNALHHRTHMKYINSSDAVIRELLQQMCITQPGNICFVHSYKQDIHIARYVWMV